MRVLYVLACVIGPLVWGVLSVLLLRVIERRFPRKPPVEKRHPPLEYHL